MKYGTYYTYFGNDGATISSFPKFKLTIIDQEDLNVYCQSLDISMKKIHSDSTDCIESLDMVAKNHRNFQLTCIIYLMLPIFKYQSNQKNK